MSRRPAGPRPAVIGTCALSGRGVREQRQLLANGLAMLDAMASQAAERGWQLDLTILPETFAWVPGTSVRETAEPIDGPTVSAVAARARAYRTHAAVPLYLRDGDTVYNSVVLLDRAGQPVGTYHKAFPVVMPDGSLEGGTTPGSTFPIFELDFGRVGVQICFDACYDDGWAALAAQEAELVIMPSAGGSTITAIASFAYRHGYYVAASSYRAPAVIVNPLGREITRAASDRDVAVVRVDLDYRLLPSRFLWTRGDDVKARYGDRVDFGWHDAEGYCLLTSRDPQLPIGRLVKDEGLETLQEFLERNRRAQDAARRQPLAGEAVEAGR